MDDVLGEYTDLFACPDCRGPLQSDLERVTCTACRREYQVADGIPLLYHPHDPGDKRDVTDIVKAFYEENPFPNYDDLDSRESLQEKARRSFFARLLDEQLPKGALVLEAGCGTGQLTNFLGLSWKRRVFGSDLCLNSLRLAKAFRDRWSIQNASFLQMNLFRPAFREQAFDLVISNGVLHHTGDPLGGFQSLARLVRPGGYILVGLYNTIGRLTTDLRRFLFDKFGDGLRFLDGHMRNRTYNEARKRAWFLDQYKHPHESKHSYDEVLQWFEIAGFQFMSSIPKIGAGEIDPEENLLAPHDKGTRLARWTTQIEMLIRGGSDGALFIMVGRKTDRRQVTSRGASVLTRSAPL
jgi:SAM-dependent methyltransferase